MNAQWMERLLQGFLYDDEDSYLCDKRYRELLIADLKSNGLIEKKKVVMTKSAAVEKCSRILWENVTASVILYSMNTRHPVRICDCWF